MNLKKRRKQKVELEEEKGGRLIIKVEKEEV